MTTTSRIVVDWKSERKFEAGRDGQPPILLDGDGIESTTPPDALLAALGSCISVDVVDILAKRRTPVKHYSVEVTGERVDTTPRRFTHITLKVSIRCDGIERVHAERAIDLAVNKYCSVKDSLNPDIPVVWTLELNGPVQD